MRLLVCLLLACGSRLAVEKLPPGAQELGSCTLADECTIVDACCSCSYGGKRVALRKDKVAEYDATRCSRCGDMPCPMQISQHASCHGTATCEHGRCQVAPHNGTDIVPIEIVPMPTPPNARTCPLTAP